jgi:hypothetical protein
VVYIRNWIASQSNFDTKIKIIVHKEINVEKFNKYKVVDDYVIIYIHRRDKTIIETIIDVEDLDRLKELNLYWHTYYDKKLRHYYVQATEYMGVFDGKPKYRMWYLHRVVMNAGKKEYVDHEDHDTLNNRKFNLRLTKQLYNTKNRSGRNSNNKSGYRNVSWVDGKWVVQIQIDGKNTCLGRFTDVDKAGKFAEEMRQKYYGKFAGNS